MSLTFIGAGYVGLVTAAVFSDLGNEVYCVDIDEKKIEKLKKAEIPFFEPQLSEIVKKNLVGGRLKFTTSYKDSVSSSDIVFICVGTPPKTNGEADLSYVFSAMEEIAKNIEKETLIVIKSTIPLGFEKELTEIADKHAKGKYEFASSPEFLKEGTAVYDTLNPDRVVIGTQSERARQTLLELHRPIPGKRVICDIRSAQLIKYASNAFLATKISYANALAVICERTGADVEKVIQGLGADARIGHSFLKPGVGYGGSCLPKDVSAFIHQANIFGYSFDLLKDVNRINSDQIENFVSKIVSAVSTNKKDLKGKSLGILGLAFKPNTDDMREAPSVKIINKLLELGAQITAYDPKSMETAKKIIPQINYANGVYEALEGKDAMIMITDWPEFLEIDMKKVKEILKSPLILDGRNIYDPSELKSLGFDYIGVGR